MLYYIRFFYAEKIFSGTECIKQIYTVPEVNWSLGSLDKAEVISLNSVHFSNSSRPLWSHVPCEIAMELMEILSKETI